MLVCSRTVFIIGNSGKNAGALEEMVSTWEEKMNFRHSCVEQKQMHLN